MEDGKWRIDKCMSFVEDQTIKYTLKNITNILTEIPQNNPKEMNWNQMVESEDANIFSSVKALNVAVCPILWATASNKLNCEHVYKNFHTGQQCSGEYYKENLPVVEQQIAKAGRTIANVLNTIFDEKYRLEELKKF